MTTVKAISKYLEDKKIIFKKINTKQYSFVYNDKQYIYDTNLKLAQLGHLISIISDFDVWFKNNCKEQTAQVIVAAKTKDQLIDINKIPTEHDGYYFPEFTANIARRINSGSSSFFTGESGAGKTECVEKLASLFGHTLLSVDFSAGTNSQELIGKFIVRNGQTEFIYGIVSLAMKNGWWLNFNEIDCATPDNLSILQGVLSGKELLISQNENEIIKPHKNFRLFATANTKGRGTDTGYTGTNFLNLAFLDRFSIFEFDYTKHEPKIVDRILDGKDKVLAKMLVDLFGLLRKASKDGNILNAVFSTRRLKEIATSIAAGESFKDAMYFDLIGRFEQTEQNTIKEFINDIFDNETYTKKNWFLGNKHYEPPKVPENTGV